MSTAARRNTSRSRRAEESENENENQLGTPSDPVPIRPPRSPLASIQDPSTVHDPAATDPKKGGLTGNSPLKAAAQIAAPPPKASPRAPNIVVRGCSSKVVPSDATVPVQFPYFELADDPAFWNDHNVQVLIRIRPISGTEAAAQNGYKRCLVQESSHTLTWTGHPETRFTFDHVACESMSQEKLFKVVGLPMVENCMSGYNSCMFAYGQTGSGKTYTMMGDIRVTENVLSEHCGITPRVFEYLFSRIREEEDARSGEQLKYSCKCSFLEIYNEQITDLLEPSSINLQLREDIKKGVYVENLKECEVSSVKDVFELLLQGTANRKIAVTHMNSESSRSHSVFTCSIESRWEKDSMTHLRFGRLNLVDLAGSERQKSSAAEGGRLKEAASINRSLSTLGLVIMTLVEIANGKHRHVPYRDSRLTFLLQDSLGGNSKTTILANVSPSICSTSETLSTLKFAQRAKLIQNNAKVNEDASGDVMALQQQIQNLKDQLSLITKHQSIPRFQCYPFVNMEQAKSCDVDNVSNSQLGGNSDTINSLGLLNQKINYPEATLTGGLRREKIAEATVLRLQEEIRHMNRLVHQREDDAQQIKTTLRLREEKLKRLELLADDLITSDGYLMEENAALSDEIRLLRERIDRNPELTQFALENMRLLEQLRTFQDFYQQGEREKLLAEISHLRNQFLRIVEGKLAVATRGANQNYDAVRELDSCRRQLCASLELNAKLTREVDDLCCQLKHYQDAQTIILNVGGYSRDDLRCQEIDKLSSVPLNLDENDIEDGIISSEQVEMLSHRDIVSSQVSDFHKDLNDVSISLEALEPQQCLTEELDNLKQDNCTYLELSKNKMHDETECEDTATLALEKTLERMHKDLEEAKAMNKHLQDDHALQLTCQHEMKHVQEQVEIETAETIIYLQEQLAGLQREVDLMTASQLSATEESVLWKTKNEEFCNRLCFLAQENMRLSDLVASKDTIISALSGDWERAIVELTSFLIDGWKSLEDASDCIGSVIDSFPQGNGWINEQVEGAIQVFIERERLIANLQKSLEDAQIMGLEMKSKLSSLKGATLAITEVQQLENDENSKELFHIRQVLGEKVSRVQELENIVKCKEENFIEAENNAKAAYTVIRKLYAMSSAESFDQEVIKSMISDIVNKKPSEIMECDSLMCEAQYAQNKYIEVNSKVAVSFPVEHNSVDTQERNAGEDVPSSGKMNYQVELAMQMILESSDTLCTLYADTESYLDSLLSDNNSSNAEVKMLICDLINDFRAAIKKFKKFKEQEITSPSNMVGCLSSEAHDLSKPANRSSAMNILNDRFAETTAMLSSIKAGFDSLFSMYENLTYKEPKVLCSNIELQLVHKNSSTDKVKQYGEEWIPNTALILRMMEESELVVDSLMEIHFQLSMLLDGRDVAGYTARGICLNESPAIEKHPILLHTNNINPSDKLAMMELYPMLKSLEERKKEVDTDCSRTRQVLSHKLKYARHDAHEKMKLASGLFLKFEEAQQTMEEAGCVITALLKANEDAKHDRDLSNQATEQLLAEKNALTEEVQSLKAFNLSEARRLESLQEQIHVSTSDIFSLISSFQGTFQRAQQTTEEELDSNCSDIVSLWHELLQYVHVSRSCLEDMMSEIMERNFALFVLHQCHVGVLIQHKRQCNVDCSSDHNLEINRKEIMDENIAFKAVEDMELLDLKVFNFSSLDKYIEVQRAFQQLESFDVKLLHESTSSVENLNDKNEKMTASLSQIQHELAIKIAQIDTIFMEKKVLETNLAKLEAALSSSQSEMEQAQKELVILSNENTELRHLLVDVYAKKNYTEELMEDKRKVIQSSEKEFFSKNSNGRKNLSFVEDIMDELKKVNNERDHLRTQIVYLNDKLEAVSALADENEAIAVEARQVAEASKSYAEEKEEEVKILERSIAALEDTISILEMKVFDMKEEVASYQLIRKDLELEVQTLTQRMLAVENAADVFIPEDSNVEGGKSRMSRQLDDRDIGLCQARRHIDELETEKASNLGEIKQYKEHISELVLHSEAQSSLYQEKFKELECMVAEVKSGPAVSNPISPIANRTEKISFRTRRSNSPFRCVASLVQQVNSEKDHELSLARLRIEELEAMAINKQKEVCMLTARLAAVDSMTHDVIRDLLGVKIDMTNYANFIDGEQLQKILKEIQEQSQESNAKDIGILGLKQKINHLTEERDSLIEEINERKTDILARQVTVERLKQRDQLLTAQNELLKNDKTNLQRKIAELDEKVRLLMGPEMIHERIQTVKTKENSCQMPGSMELSKRLAQSDKLLFQGKR